MALLPQHPDERKKLLLGMLVVLALGYFGWERVHVPRSERNVALEERLQALQTTNQAARTTAAAASAEAAVERQLTLRRDQLAAVEALIPSSEELPDLLNAIAAQADAAGVELSLIQPVGATQEQFYTRRTYDLAALGSYHALADFVTRTASMPRIVTPINLSLSAQPETTRDGEQRLEARFSIETYVVGDAGAGS